MVSNNNSRAFPLAPEYLSEDMSNYQNNPIKCVTVPKLVLFDILLSSPE
jgi:hypothetical protein